MKWLPLLLLTGCQAMKITSVGEAPEPQPENKYETKTVGEPIEPMLPEISPAWWILGAGVLFWFLMKED